MRAGAHLRLPFHLYEETLETQMSGEVGGRFKTEGKDTCRKISTSKIFGLGRFVESVGVFLLPLGLSIQMR